MIIDVHTHTFPDKIAEKAIEKLKQAGRIVPFTDGTVQGLKDSMQRAGIDYSVVLPVATNPEKVRSMNDVSIEMTGKNGLIYFGCMHPDCEYWHEELGRIADAGLKGIKIHPVYQGVDIDDERFVRILTRAGELGLTVITHAGDDIGFPGKVHCHPEMVVRALKKAGPVQLILAHMGGWKNWRDAEKLLPQENVLIDTAFALGEITPLREDDYSEDERKLLSKEDFCRLVRAFGSERVLFGTDSPWADQQKSVADILALELTEKEKENILWRNAKRILCK